MGRTDNDTGAARILVVDDETAVRDLVTTVLASLGGFEVEAVPDGGAAIQRLTDEEHPDGSPDLVVLDVMMPGIDGFALLAWIRRHEYLYDLPVVMLTARTERADEGEGWQQGCDAYVRKPFEPQELVEVVRTTLAASPELRIARRRHRLLEMLTG